MSNNLISSERIAKETLTLFHRNLRSQRSDVDVLKDEIYNIQQKLIGTINFKLRTMYIKQIRLLSTELLMLEAHS